MGVPGHMGGGLVLKGLKLLLGGTRVDAVTWWSASALGRFADARYVRATAPGGGGQLTFTSLAVATDRHSRLQIDVDAQTHLGERHDRYAHSGQHQWPHDLSRLSQATNRSRFQGEFTSRHDVAPAEIGRGSRLDGCRGSRCSDTTTATYSSGAGGSNKAMEKLTILLFLGSSHWQVAWDSNGHCN
jgi:hypothetical protein